MYLESLLKLKLGECKLLKILCRQWLGVFWPYRNRSVDKGYYDIAEIFLDYVLLLPTASQNVFARSRGFGDVQHTLLLVRALSSRKESPLQNLAESILIQNSSKATSHG